MQKVDFPVNFRQLMNLFAHCKDKSSVQALAETIHFDDLTTHKLYGALLGRLPESETVCARYSVEECIPTFLDVLRCAEFQERIVSNILAAFPEKRRLLYVHIPKSAGTDLATDLSARYPNLHQTLMYPTDVSTDDLHERLFEFATEVALSDSILVCGHNTLNWYIDHGAYRHGDALFTVVRDPIEIVISNVNYVMTLLFDSKDDRADRDRFLLALGEPHLSPDMDDNEKAEIARRILQHESMIPANSLCAYLGNGDFPSAINSIARSDIELVNIREYEKWRRNTFDLPVSERKNTSAKYVTFGSLDSELQQRVLELTTEDRRLYPRLLDAWERAARPSITGLEVVEDLRRTAI